MNVIFTIFLLYTPMLIFGICEAWKEHKMWKKAMIEKWNDVKEWQVRRMSRFTTIDGMVCEVTTCGNCPFHKDEQDMGAMAEYCEYPTRKGNRIVRGRKSTFPDDCPLYYSKV